MTEEQTQRLCDGLGVCRSCFDKIVSCYKEIWLDMTNEQFVSQCFDLEMDIPVDDLINIYAHKENQDMEED